MAESIKTAGIQTEERLTESLTDEERKKIAIQVGSALIAGGLFVSGEVYQYFFPGYESIAGMIYLIGAAIASIPILWRAAAGFFDRESRNIMEQLVSLALLASIAKGDFRTAILIPLIMLFVHFLEERSILGAKSAIEGLKILQANEACLITPDGEKTIKAETLDYGDVIRIKPGDMIPIDGEVIEGQSSVNQSSLTGEMIPEDKTIGDRVYAGTINIQGMLIISVTKKTDETSLSKIVSLMKEAEQSKTGTMRIIEKYISYYLPFIVTIAIAVLVVTQDVDRVISILVVSCPCAQVLVSPTAMVAALAVASRNGILLKNSKFLEILGTIKTAIFDKTGTLTSGNLDVVGLEAMPGISRDELLISAATAAWASKHPVSRAIIRAADDVDFEKTTKITESTGFGVIAESNSGKIALGSHKWFVSGGLKLSEEPVHYGPVVWVVRDDVALGNIKLADSLRPDAKSAIEHIRNLGVEKVILVTGDRKDAAGIIKNELTLEDVFCECLPADKLKIVEKEKEESGAVLVVGDGINDSLALVKADVGISMGAMGSDVAVQSSDIALMGNELEKLPLVIRLSRKTKRIIYQNMGIATISSAVMITLAGMGIISALTGAFLHNIGAFLVVLNSSRLLNFDRNLPEDESGIV